MPIEVLERAHVFEPAIISPFPVSPRMADVPSPDRTLMVICDLSGAMEFVWFGDGVALFSTHSTLSLEPHTFPNATVALPSR